MTEVKFHVTTYIILILSNIMTVYCRVLLFTCTFLNKFKHNVKNIKFIGTLFEKYNNKRIESFKLRHYWKLLVKNTTLLLLKKRTSNNIKQNSKTRYKICWYLSKSSGNFYLTETHLSKYFTLMELQFISTYRIKHDALSTTLKICYLIFADKTLAYF